MPPCFRLVNNTAIHTNFSLHLKINFDITNCFSMGAIINNDVVNVSVRSMSDEYQQLLLF